MIVRIRWTIKGEHVHARVFVGRHETDTFAYCGMLGLHKQEFVALVAGKFRTQFIEEPSIAPGNHQADHENAERRADDDAGD